MNMLLEINKINFAYGDIQVLWDVSLGIAQGEIISLLGPNGAGKSTLLKLIIGAYKPSSGDIKFEGSDIVGEPTNQIVEKGLILVPEGRRTFPKLTVLENLELGAISKRSLPKKDENIERCFSLFPILSERKKQLAGTLSGGEMQMLAISRGLMAVPKLLIFDEPSFGLAPRIVSKIFDTIREINKDGVTIFLVEQNVRQALRYCDKGYVLETGRIILQGKSPDLAENNHVKEAYIGL